MSMADLIDVKVPDIGDFKDVPVIEIPVKVGDMVNECWMEVTAA